MLLQISLLPRISSPWMLDGLWCRAEEFLGEGVGAMKEVEHVGT